MTKKELKQKIIAAMSGMKYIDNNYTLSHMNIMYSKIYDEIPNVFPVGLFVRDNIFENMDRENMPNNNESFKIDVLKSIQNIMDYLDKTETEYILWRMTYAALIIFTTDGIIFAVHSDMIVNMYIKNLEFPKWVIGCLVAQEKQNSSYSYLIKTSAGISIKTMQCKETDNTGIMDNYNDDFPAEKIERFLSAKNEPGIIILHGEPGTGKTTYVRHLINSGKYNFIYCDQSVFGMLMDPTLITSLTNVENPILILEDCECLLADRGTRQNNLLSGLLNITDGLLADSMNIKIICTFNADLATLDKALLRKGRLKIKYEFKKLKKEKVKLIAERNNLDMPKHYVDMTLADLYNQDDNGGSTHRKSVGFGK